MDFHVAKVVAMAGTVILTSGDDALWLVPFIGSRKRSSQRHMVNMVVWFCTLQSLVLAAQLFVWLGVGLGRAGLFESLGMHWPLELCLSFFGVVAVWIIMIIFLIKWILKLYHKAQKKKLKKAQKASEGSALKPNEEVVGYGGSGQKEGETTPSEEREQPSLFSDICSVCSLTIMGGLDEVAYFPSLLLTRMFTLEEMCLGTLLAAVILLIILQWFLARFTPVLELMDKIPLWVIVAIFASVMTILFTVELENS